MEEQVEKTLILKGSTLKVYAHALHETYLRIVDEPWYKRNPYLRSASMKRRIEEMDDLIMQLISILLDYSALLSKSKVCKEKELGAYYYVYQFLFSYQDELKRQENIHLLLIKSASLMEQFEHFFDYTNRFVDYQSQKLTNL